MTRSLVLASALPDASGNLSAAAAVAVALASRCPDRNGRPGAEGTLLVEVGGERARGPTLLASAESRELEARLRGAGVEAAARGRLTWLRCRAQPGWLEQLLPALDEAAAGWAVVCLPAALWREAFEAPELAPSGVLIRADLPAQRSLAALAAVEALQAGLRVRIATRSPGRVAATRALAGIDPGGEAGRRSARLADGLARRLGSRSGQALPLALGGILGLVFCTLVLAALGGAVTGTGRVQRAADLVALSAARSMRDDFDRLFVSPIRPDGSVDPDHLSKAEYLRRASAAALEAADRNGIAPARVRIEFPDSGSFAPLRARAEVTASLDVAALPELPVDAHSEARASPPATGDEPAGAPQIASGGGYSGRLVYRNGEPMCSLLAALVSGSRRSTGRRVSV